jgi:hypothetical protein
MGVYGAVMKSTNVHYEVLGQRGTAWTIIAVIDDQEKALAKAKEAQPSYRAVKVMRERFDKTSNTYRSGQIFFAGTETKQSKFDHDDMPSVCWKVEDFYSYEGRRAINRLLRKELTEWGLTATELIHSPDMVQKIQDNGTSVQRAVQQTAIVQIRETGQGVQERIKQIYELIEKGSVILRRDAPDFPEIQGDRIDGVTDAISDKESRSYLLHGALAKYLSNSRNFNDKLTRVLGLVRADHPAWVHEVADNFVAELLSTGKVLPVLVGKRESLKEEMRAAAELSCGQASQDDRRFTPDARMVNRLIAAGKMPKTQQALTRFLCESMNGSRRLVEGTLLEESAAVSDLATSLKRPGGVWIGEIAMVEAIGKRCARWLHPEAISDLLVGAKDPEQKFERLMALSRNVFGNSNKRKLGEFLLPIISSPQGEVFLTLEGGTVTAKLKRLRQMQDQVLQCGLQEMHSKKIAEKLDDLACRVVRNAQLIERMTQGAGSPVEKCFSLLRMTVEGYFTRGKADMMARDAIRRSIATPDFTAGFLETMRSSDEKIQKLDALSKLLKQAGIDIQEAMPDTGTKPDEPAAASA